MKMSMSFDDLSPEIKEKAAACKTTEDILALANEVGYELSEEELDAISGGKIWCWSYDCQKKCYTLLG